jgi:putative membrane protein
MYKAEKHKEINLTEPILRDYMAIERTVMANERTFLSYIRAALGLFFGGVSFMEFFDNVVIHMVGWLFIPLGLATFGVGLWRYKKIQRLILGAEDICRLEQEKEKPVRGD